MKTGQRIDAPDVAPTGAIGYQPGAPDVFYEHGNGDFEHWVHIITCPYEGHVMITVSQARALIQQLQDLLASVETSKRVGP